MASAKMNSGDFSPAGDVYYSCNDRDKYRSVHPPHSSLHDIPYERFSSSAERYSPLSCVTSTANFPLDSKSAAVHDVDLQKLSRDGPSDGNFFQMASIDDCYCYHEKNHQNASVLDVTSHSLGHSNQFMSPLSVAPPFLCSTHFFVRERSWSSVESMITEYLRKSRQIKWEHMKSEHLWRCDIPTTSCPSNCSFQIRVYIDADGKRFIVELQMISGDDSFLNQIYQSLMRDLRSTSEGCQHTAAEVVDDESYDTSFEFLLIPVLEMVQNDCPDMQSEALRMACELSNPLESPSCQPQVGANYVSASVGEQMRDFGFIPVLVHLVLKNLSSISAVSSSKSLHGQISHQALTIILNLADVGEHKSIKLALGENVEVEEFMDLLNRILKIGLEGYNDSPNLQSVCSKLLGMLSRLAS